MRKKKTRKYRKVVEFPLPLEDVTKLLHKCVIKFHKIYTQWDYDELEAEAWVAAVECARGFNPKRAKFSTYLCNWIKFALLDYVRDPTNHHSPDSIVTKHGYTISYNRINNCKKHTQVNVVEKLERNLGKSPDEVLNSLTINDLIQPLTKRQKDIITKYYGLGVTLEVLAKKYKITTERVRQIAEYSLKVIRQRNNIDQKNLQYKRDPFFSKAVKKQNELVKRPSDKIISKVIRREGSHITLTRCRDLLKELDNRYVLRDDYFWAVRKKVYPKVNFKLRVRNSIINSP